MYDPEHGTESEYDDDEEVYDDPFDVVMYDIDESDDLYALIEMLSDTTRSWYARRRLNSLAAAGPLSALVADIIVDSLGRRWNPLQHPRDRFGRFIETGGFIRWLAREGDWLRGQISRIDSDGVIHARSVGNDRIPDGSPLRFKPEMASKLVSIESPLASLDNADAPDLDAPNLDADIPDFPEASATQKRIYNALESGDLPAEDLDVFRSPVDGDLTGEDFADELRGLEERGLIEIDTSGPKPRARRTDDSGANVVDIGDDQIAEIPDDETPDLADSPLLTKDQRDLLDRLAAADANENDGVRQDELGEVDEDDFKALIDAGALVPGDDGNYFLENPENDDSAEPAAPVEQDLTSEIFEASKIIDDPDGQEAFQHYAEELARPGDENNAPLPDEISPAKRRNAESAANKWWAERNGGAVDDTTVPEPDAAPETAVEETDPKDVLNPRNQALADTLMAEYFPDDEFDNYLDTDEGVEYRGAIKRLFDAEDLDENGFNDQADLERDKANRSMERVGVSPEDIDGWPLEVQNVRAAEGEGDVPEADVPEADVPEDVAPDSVDVPEADVPEDVPEDVPVDPVDDTGTDYTWEDYDARMQDEGPESEFFARLEQEAQIAEELGLDHFADDAPWSWQNMVEQLGFRPTELMYYDTNGSVGEALAKDPDQYTKAYENELLQRFQDEDGNIGPEVLQLRKAGLVESDDSGTQWRLSQAGRDRLGLSDELPDVPDDAAPDVTPEPDATPEPDVPDAGTPDTAVPDAVDVPEPDAAPDAAPDAVATPDVVPDAPADVAPVADVPEPDATPDAATDATTSPEAMTLLQKIADGGGANRSERDLEDQLHDAGLLEEDGNGNSRLTQAGADALTEAEAGDTADVPDATPDAAPDTVPDAAPVTEDVTPTTPVVPDDVVDDTDVPDVVDDATPDVVDDATQDATVDTSAAPTLPDPSDPNDATPGFQKTGGQSGLNAGGFYDVLEDNGNLKAGDKVYIKNGRSPEHAQNEALANRLYDLAGVPVPELVLGDSNDRLVSKVIDDLHDLNPRDPADGEALKRVREDFAVDAWLANWDGQNPGNTMVGPDGTPYRIDVGSAMEYRAQGGLKGDAFGDTVGEIDALRDPSINYGTAQVFGPMYNDDIRASVERLAQVNPDDVRSTITASGLPDSDALADKMITRRSNLLSQFGVADPYDSNATPAVASGDSPSVPAPTPATTAKNVVQITARQQKSRADFVNRTSPYLEVSYVNGDLVMADGSTLDFDTYYHTAKGGEGNHGKVVEVLDQERYPGWVRMEFLDGSEQVRHVLGTGTGRGGLVPSGQDDVDEWERQTSVTGDKATEAVDPSDFPMADGNVPLVGTQVVFDVGGQEEFGSLLYFNPKWDNGGRAFIVPEGGGKIYERPVRRIRAQTQEEINSDIIPIAPSEMRATAAQYLPQPRYSPQTGALLSREDQPINIGDWMAQRSGGDGLVGEVISIPDQNLYPGWVNLRFPDGEVRSRHVEGFTEVGKLRGAGGLRHADAPDPNTWTRQRRVKGEEGDVLSYDFSGLETLDGTPIQVGEEVFGTDRKGRSVAGLLIRVNPHLKRNGETVPTGFVWQNGREITVDLDKITNTPPPPSAIPPPPRVPRVTRTTTSNVRTPTPRPASPGGTSVAPPTNVPGVRPAVSAANTPPAYSPGKGDALDDDALDALDTDVQRLRTSPRTNGVHPELAALYEEQDYDALPLVVGQEEFQRLVDDEGYIPIIRSVASGTDPTTHMEYHDAYKYGAYFAGDGIYGNGSYFAYGSEALDQSRYYGNRRIYAAVRPGDMKIINYRELRSMQDDELNDLRQQLQGLDRNSDEYKKIRNRMRLLSDAGHYAVAKGYDAIVVPHADSSSKPDDNLSKWGYLVLLNRSATVVSDTHFEDRDDIFHKGFPATLAPTVPAPIPVTPDGTVPGVPDGSAPDAGEVAPADAPVVV